MVCTWCGRSWACKWIDALKPVETSDPPMSNKEAQATTWKGCRIGHFDRTPAGRSLVLQERGCGSELLSHRHCIGRRPQRTTVFEPVFKVIWAWVPKYLCTKYLMVACVHVSWDISRWACDQIQNLSRCKSSPACERLVVFLGRGWLRSIFYTRVISHGFPILYKTAERSAVADLRDSPIWYPKIYCNTDPTRSPKAHQEPHQCRGDSRLLR